MRLTWLSPGDPTQRTGGYLYNQRVVEGLRARGHTVDVQVVAGEWPLGPAHLPPLHDGPVVADGLLWTAVHEQVADLSRVLVLVHSVLAAEGGPELVQPEATALRGVGVVVATGGPTERDLAAMGVSSVSVVPGTERASRIPTTDRGRLLVLGTLTARKRQLWLLDVLDGLRHLDWTLALVGSATRDELYGQQVKERAATFDGRVQVHGEVGGAGVEAALAACDLLVHPARYEAWGMALAEAMARGVPVLSTPAGGVEGGGAWVVDDDTLPPALTSLLSEPHRLQALAEASWTRGQELPTWEEQVTRFERELQRLEAPR